MASQSTRAPWVRIFVLVAALTAALAATVVVLITRAPSAAAATCTGAGARAFTISASPCDGLVGDSITLTASGQCPSGEYYFDATRFAPLQNGSISVTVPNEAAGTHQIIGDCNAAATVVRSTLTFTIDAPPPPPPTSNPPSTSPSPSPSKSRTRSKTPPSSSTAPPTHSDSPTSSSPPSSSTSVASPTSSAPTKAHPTKTKTRTRHPHPPSSSAPASNSVPSSASSSSAATTGVLTLVDVSIAPGGGDVARGQGCVAGSAVHLSVEGTTVGDTTADANGTFSAPLQLASFPVGRYQVLAACGPMLAASLDVVLASQLNPITSTLALIVLFLLIGLVIYRRRLLPSHYRAPGPIDPPEEES